MHYYKFNIADYRKDTTHLSPVEHYIYRTLIDTYHLDENPLGYDSVIRRLRLSTEQIKDLDNVLKDFFVEKEGRWHHLKIDELISEYNAMAIKNKANGSKGGRPKKPTGLPSETEIKPTGNPNHKPLTTNHKPSLKDNEQEFVSFAGFWMIYPNKTNKQAGEKAWKKLDNKQKELAYTKLPAFIAGLPDFQKPLRLHASTYLNNERWNDEAQPPSNIKRQTKDFDKTDYSQIPEGFES